MDYAAAPSQPIVQGFVTIATPVSGFSFPLFTGVGLLPNGIRTIGGSSLGDYTFTLDEGLIGNVGIDPVFGRSLITIRGSAAAGGKLASTINTRAVQYIPSVQFGVPVTTVRVVLATTGLAQDPVGLFGNGFEIVIWRGNAGPDNYESNLIGPLFAPIVIG